MKSVFVNIALLLIQFTLNAQEMQDTCQVANSTTPQVSISLSDSANLKTEYDEAVELIRKLKCENVSLKEKESISINYIKQEVVLREHIMKTDTILINLASNFLYIPFEAYSVQKIAIPAYKTIFDSTLRQKHQIKYDLLDKYQNHVKKFMDFLNLIQIDLKKPFRKRDLAIQWVEKFKEQDFYKDYFQYDDYKSTYLGKLFIEVESRLNCFDGQSNKADFLDIISKLDKCLKTIEEL